MNFSGPFVSVPMLMELSGATYECKGIDYVSGSFVGKYICDDRYEFVTFGREFVSPGRKVNFRQTKRPRQRHWEWLLKGISYSTGSLSLGNPILYTGGFLVGSASLYTTSSLVDPSLWSTVIV